MARKKEPQRVDLNRQRISDVAKEMFLKYGVESTKISEIAKEAGMSKSTLYVYFKSKEEIQNYISLEAMTYLHDELKRSLAELDSDSKKDFHTVYLCICHALVNFKQHYPSSFALLVEEICVDEEELKKDPVLAKTYETGEQINLLIANALGQAMDSANSTSSEKSQNCMPMDTSPNSAVSKLLPVIFAQWGALYGLITLADNKEQYIKKSMSLSKTQFLEQGFEQMYLMLKALL